LNVKLVVHHVTSRLEKVKKDKRAKLGKLRNWRSFFRFN